MVAGDLGRPGQLAQQLVEPKKEKEIVTVHCHSTMAWNAQLRMDLNQGPVGQTSVQV